VRVRKPGSSGRYTELRSKLDTLDLVGYGVDGDLSIIFFRVAERYLGRGFRLVQQFPKAPEHRKTIHIRFGPIKGLSGDLPDLVNMIAQFRVPLWSGELFAEPDNAAEWLPAWLRRKPGAERRSAEIQSNSRRVFPRLK
jgi:hypothetical protein